MRPTENRKEWQEVAKAEKMYIGRVMKRAQNRDESFTVTVTVHGMRWFHVRVWIAIQLVKIGV